MRKITLALFFLSVFPFTNTYAQQPPKPGSAEIYNQLQKLNFLGTVLYIAAHPDDENTRLISYLANEKKARTGYMSLTRGDGGQNLIGPELRDQLGAIRTQELLEARKIDGGEQFFSRANDFGYSKNPDETLRIWNKDEVLSDIVYVIRKFQPDVIINRFDARTPGTTHGHHTASAILSLEAFDKSADSQFYPNQMKSVEPWQAKRVFFNTSWFFYGSKEMFDKADKTNLYSLQTGVYYPLLGKSNQEIAALSRSRHQSQGFGSTGSRGAETEYLELIKGQANKDKNDIFEGIDTSWNRIAGGKAIGNLVSAIIKAYDFENPAASIPNLVKAYSMINALNENHWKPVKINEIKKIISACAGLYLEAAAETQETTAGSSVKLKLEAINRSAVSMQLSNLQSDFATKNSFTPILLENNVLQTLDLQLMLPESIGYTQPYWLKEKESTGMYIVNDQNNVGIPDIIRDVKVTFDVLINGVTIPFERDVIYKFNDNRKGESYRPFDIIPDISVSFSDKVVVFSNEKAKPVSIKLSAGKDNASGNVTLELPNGWTSTPASTAFSLSKKSDVKTIDFVVTPPKYPIATSAKAFAMSDGKKFDHESISINYDHISKQQILRPAETRLLRLDIRTGYEKIAYIMGAGDEVPKSLRQMGYEVWVLKPEEITAEKLQEFDVVITGIRAYNTVSALASKQNILFEFVKRGKTMIVQYNTLDDFVTKDIAPFPIKISRDRVTEEDAKVTFLAPENPVLNYPNKITAADFEGWKQEQGLYYPSEWDGAFTPILSSADKGETPKNGALLIAKYGKGTYIYTGLSFFRELPEGVSGAFRLMANLISTKNQ